MRIIKPLFVCILGLLSCDSYYQKQIGESYFIRYVDLKYTMDIGFGDKESSEGLVGPTVFEVHWDDKYILVKNHPDFVENRQKTDYYIIEKVKFGEKRARDYMKGPLSKVAFEHGIKQLNLKPAEMKSIFYEDLK